MTVPRLLSLGEYWKCWPPVHKSVALYLGIGERSASKPLKTQGEIEAFIAAAQAANFSGS
jgi:hypothetical protein